MWYSHRKLLVFFQSSAGFDCLLTKQCLTQWEGTQWDVSMRSQGDSKDKAKDKAVLATWNKAKICKSVSSFSENW
jgi:hypothetical protein